MDVEAKLVFVKFAWPFGLVLRPTGEQLLIDRAPAEFAAGLRLRLQDRSVMFLHSGPARFFS